MPIRKVAIMMSPSEDRRGLLDGITQYALEKGPWEFYFDESGFQLPSGTLGFAPHGILAMLQERPKLLPKLAQINAPVVDLSPGQVFCTVPQVKPDDIAVGHAVAVYFLERGFRHFAFRGPQKFPYSRDRLAGYRTHLQNRGHDVLTYQPAKPWWDSAAQRQTETRWLIDLPKPVALFASDDLAGQHSIVLCRILDIPVPDQVAVVAVNNQVGVCRMMRPTLSSVPLDQRRAGYLAAEFLDQLMQGHFPRHKLILVPPLPIITRGSSEILALEDAEVRTAVVFIRDNGHRRITVKDVLEQTTISRRVLEIRFKKALNRTLLQEISHAHVEHAKRLLTQTDLPMPQIARASGFKTAQWMSAVFIQKERTPPTAYRKKHRAPQ